MGGSPIGKRAIENFFCRDTSGLHNKIQSYLENDDILTEGEFEHILWMEIFNWMREKDEDKYKFNFLPYRIRSQLYFRDNETYPDLEIRLGERIILIIELKHYHKKTFSLKDIIKDVEKNNQRCKDNEEIIAIVIFTSSLTHEVLVAHLRELEKINQYPLQNHIIPLNRWG